MNIKLDNALTRLQSILPLEANLAECAAPTRALYQEILHSFVSRGRAPARQEMADYVSDLDTAIALLQEKAMATLSDSGDLVGAYPFTMEQREHRVRVNGYRVYAMCALDALAISPMFALKTEIASQCRVTGAVIAIQQSGLEIDNMQAVADVKLGIAWAAAETTGSCADTLCMEMMFLKDGDVAQRWQDADPVQREIFSLSEAVEFARRFFSPLLASSSVPR